MDENEIQHVRPQTPRRSKSFPSFFMLHLLKVLHTCVFPLLQSERSLCFRVNRFLARNIHAVQAMTCTNQFDNQCPMTLMICLRYAQSPNRSPLRSTIIGEL